MCVIIKTKKQKKTEEGKVSFEWRHHGVTYDRSCLVCRCQK